jgi:hypothetical protein
LQAPAVVVLFASLWMSEVPATQDGRGTGEAFVGPDHPAHIAIKPGAIELRLLHNKGKRQRVFHS